MRIPLTALPLLVIDKANKKAGAPLPKTPTISRVGYLSRGIDERPFIASGKAHRHDMLIRRQASSIAVKPCNDFLISIYDEPQISVSRPSSIQFCALW